MVRLKLTYEVDVSSQLPEDWSLITTWQTRMWANAQRDGRPAEYSWRPMFNAAKFG